MYTASTFTLASKRATLTSLDDLPTSAALIDRVSLHPLLLCLFPSLLIL